MTPDKEQELKDRILKEAEEQKLPCSKAFALAADMNSTVAAVGRACNELEVKIISCQLGCF